MSIPQRIVMLSMNKVVDFTAANKQSETECESMGSEEGGSESGDGSEDA